MKFEGICLVTKDVIKLRNFYSRLFKCEVKGDEEFSYIDIEGSHITFYSETALSRTFNVNIPFGSVGRAIIEVAVENIGSYYHLVKASRYTVLKPLTTQEWGITSFWIQALDGNIINFLSKN